MIQCWLVNNKADLRQGTMYTKPNSVLNLLGITVLATAVAGLLYFGFFQLAPWIWSQNMPFRPEEVAVWQLLWLKDRDGIELYALYILMFLDLLLLYVLSIGWQRLAGKHALYFLFFSAALACAYIGSIGFHPPMNSLAKHAMPDILARSFTVLAVILPIAALLHYLRRHSPYSALALAALLLIPACFITTGPIEWYDYSFILAPSLSLLQGASIPDVYLPYDLMLSLLGLVWMKLQLDLNSFQVVGQCGYYLLLLGIFAFSMRWFFDKRLSVFLLIALVLVRIYAGPFDSAHALQLTPIRIDLWFILLALVYFKGTYHWSVGLSCGLLLLLHKNFGIIYTAAYIQLLLTLCVLDADTFSGRSIKAVSTAFGALFKRNRHNFILILLGACAHYFLFREVNEPGNFSFESLRISFTKISVNSFYWYVVIVSGMSFTLLLRLRSRVSGNYLDAGLFLVYLSIGNSLYFFGHSHENAIIVLSSILLLLFFLLLDLAGRYIGDGTEEAAKSFLRKNLGMVVSLVFIMSVAIWYGDNITRKGEIQARNVIKGQFIYPSEVPERYILNNIAKIRTIIGNSPKVYFVGDYDLLFYYFGRYALVGYYNPVYSWISRHEFDKFLQGLVDQGYYLVVDEGLVDVLTPIRFSNSKSIGRRWVVWK
jgi:hypothetical protein